MHDAWPIGLGDTVVVVNRSGELVRDHARRVLRGVVLSINPCGFAVVLLARSGRQATVNFEHLRRCPALAYCRPAQMPGAA
jgi:hypothetical protein